MRLRQLAALPLSAFTVSSTASLVALSLKDRNVLDINGLLYVSKAGLDDLPCIRYAKRVWLDPAYIAAQAVAVCAAEAKVGGAYIAVVTEPAAPLPEVADIEEETELADEAPIAPSSQLLHHRAPWHLSSCIHLNGRSKPLQLLPVNGRKSRTISSGVRLHGTTPSMYIKSTVTAFGRPCHHHRKHPQLARCAQKHSKAALHQLPCHMQQSSRHSLQTHPHASAMSHALTHCLCVKVCHGGAEAVVSGEAGGEGAAEGEAAPEASPATAEGEEGEGEEGPPKPDYSKNSLEYIVTCSGQVQTLLQQGFSANVRHIHWHLHWGRPPLMLVALL